MSPREKWTPEMDRLLKEMRGDVSAEVIAQHIGKRFDMDLTRCAVLGRTHRLCLENIKPVSTRPRYPKRRPAIALAPLGPKAKRTPPPKPPKVELTRYDLRRMLAEAVRNTAALPIGEGAA